MQFCQSHWEQLRAAIDARGLAPLVSRNGQEGMEAFKAWLADSPDGATFDPLVSAHFMIVDRALHALGPYLLGDYCPVCEVVRVHPKPCLNGCTDEDVERAWINGPADGVLRHVQESPVLSAILTIAKGN
jgi:hypothetical protein